MQLRMQLLLSAKTSYSYDSSWTSCRDSRRVTQNTYQILDHFIVVSSQLQSSFSRCGFHDPNVIYVGQVSKFAWRVVRVSVVVEYCLLQLLLRYHFHCSYASDVRNHSHFCDIWYSTYGHLFWDSCHIDVQMYDTMIIWSKSGHDISWSKIILTEDIQNSYRYWFFTYVMQLMYLVWRHGFSVSWLMISRRAWLT